jgi:DNA-binding beta-propeller fold protein YncE
VIPRAPVALVLLAGAGCMRAAPLPDPGPCAVLPEGTYAYGQMGIGTCLAGPVDFAWLDDGNVLAVANANPFRDFTRGSVVFLDMERLDTAVSRVRVSDLALDAVEVPDFAADMALDPASGILAVTTRLSADARDRRARDPVVFIDASDPRAPVPAAVGPDGTDRLGVGWDPVGIDIDPATRRGWVVNRTGHDVAQIDLAAAPVALLPPGGPARVDAGAFEDVDGGGSTFGFVTLDAVDAPGSVPSAWTLAWRSGTVRAWVPDPGAGGGEAPPATPPRLRAWIGNGEGSWREAGDGFALDLDGQVDGMVDPAVMDAGDTVRVVFAEPSGARLRAATLGASTVTWSLDGAAVLEARPGAWDAALSAPTLARNAVGWRMAYVGESDGVRGIGIATSEDGARFSRARDAAVIALAPGAGAPSLLWDSEASLWRLWYADGAGGLAEAESVDGVTWTPRDAALAGVGLAAPEVHRWAGAFHLVAAVPASDGWDVRAWRSVDGHAWRDDGLVGTLPATVAPAVALQVNAEGLFALSDTDGDVDGFGLVPGMTREDAVSGWRARVAVGQLFEPASVGWDSVRVGGPLADDAPAQDGVLLALAMDDGSSAIGWTDVAGTELGLAPELLFDADEAGCLAVDAPVGWVQPDGSRVVLYACETEGVQRVARATSVDGMTWTHDGMPALAPRDGWTGGGVVPGSVESRGDGGVRLWISGFDGTHWRIGAADGDADGTGFTPLGAAEDGWLLDLGRAGAWDDAGVRDPWVVTEDGVTHLWYAGYDGAAWSIGHARRDSDADAFAGAVDVLGVSRPVLRADLGTFGADGLERPVVRRADGGWVAWYTGLDAGQARPGLAWVDPPDRWHRDLRLPTAADRVGFDVRPARDGDSISLDVTLDGATLDGLGCSALTRDDVRGFLYVGCKLRPWVYVLDVRDDGVPGDPDLNAFDLEAVLLVETTTNGVGGSSGMGSGLRAMWVDPVRGWLWGVSDEPEALYALDLARVADDDDAQVVREGLVTMLPLPRAGSRDAGVGTQSVVGPAALAIHPDGRHLFVSNFNHNSVSVVDLDEGPGGTVVGETRDLGENPYALTVSPDGRWLVVGMYLGELDGRTARSTLTVLDADPGSPSFLRPLTTVANR